MWRLGRQPGLSGSLRVPVLLCSSLEEEEQICAVNLNLMFYGNGRKYPTFAYGRNIGLCIHIFGGGLVTSPERWLMGPLLILLYIILVS